MARCVLSLDLGTTTIKAALVDGEGRVAGMASAPSPDPQGPDGLFDALDYERSMGNTVSELVERDRYGNDVTGLCISSQRATLVLADEKNTPVAPAMSWMGTGCAAEADTFYEVLGRGRFHQMTGLAPGPIYTLPKLVHLRSTAPGTLERAARIHTLHDWILSRMSGGEIFTTDHSNASATGLYHVTDRRWIPEVLDRLEISETQLPAIVPAGTRAGSLVSQEAGRMGLPEDLPLFVGGGDQQCAAVGAGALGPGRCVLSLGTAAALMTPLDRCPDHRPAGLLLMAHLDESLWHMEGFLNSWGSALDLGCRLLGLQHVSELETLAEGSRAEDPPLFLPFPAGVGTPEMRGDVRACFHGLDVFATREDLARAVISGLACEVCRVIETMRGTTDVTALAVVGGAGQPGPSTRILSDVTGLPLMMLQSKQAAVLGAASAAWCGVLGLDSPTRAATRFQVADVKHVQPRDRREEAHRMYERYTLAVRTQLARSTTEQDRV